MRLVNILIIIQLVIIASSVAAAEEATVPADTTVTKSGNIRYVNDKLYINLRREPALDSENIKVIPSGTELVILQQDEETGMSLARLESGEKGWVLDRYLTDEPIARDRLAQLEARLSMLSEDKQHRASKIAGLQQENRSLKIENQSLKQENQRLEGELTAIKNVSEDAVQLQSTNRDLQRTLDRQVVKISNLEKEKESASSKLTWIVFITAILALALGFYIGNTPFRHERQLRRISL